MIPQMEAGEDSLGKRYRWTSEQDENLSTITTVINAAPHEATVVSLHEFNFAPNLFLYRDLYTQ